MAAVVVPVIARAQSWPSETIKIVVPFAPGGSVDEIPRLVQGRLRERLGVPVIIENRPGASGTLGAAIVAKAPPDGYTWLSIADTLTVSPSMMPDLSFDAQRDLDPVLLIGTSPYVLASNPSRPFKTLADIVDAAKQRPASISYASFGNASGGHLAMVLLAKNAGVEFVQVPYRGSAPAVTDTIAGHVDLVIASAALITPHLQSGTLRGIVQLGPDRLPALSDLPTVSESGFPGSECVIWWGIFTAAGVPKPIIDRFRAELVAGFRDQRVAKQISETMQIKLALAGPEQLRKLVSEQIRRWRDVVRENKITIKQ